MTIKNIIKESLEKNPMAIKEALEEELRARVARAISEKTETIDEGHGVFMKGGSVGSKTGPSKPFKVHDTLDAAKAHAKRLNAQLTPGEKQHYGIKYHVKPVSEGYVVEEVEDLDEVSKATLGRYIKRAAGDIGFKALPPGQKKMFDADGSYDKKMNLRKTINRTLGIQKAANKLTKEDLDEAAEPGTIKDGYYVTDHNGHVAHDKSFPDSKSAGRYADRKEDTTGYTHRVHHVKAGKIANQWDFEGGSMDPARRPFSDFKGDPAKQHIRKVPDHFLHGSE